MMDKLLRLFDLFNETARQLAGYLPQSGEDLIRLFQQVSLLANDLNLWVSGNLGVNFQAALAPVGRLIVFGFTFLFEFLKQLVGRI